MADQRNRGGKKQGTGRQKDAGQTLGVHDREGAEGTAKRPPEGQPGGPKQPGKSGRGQSQGKE